MDSYLEGVERAMEIIVEEQTTEHENDNARFVQTMKRLQDIVSNRLDGVVIQKPAGEERAIEDCKKFEFKDMKVVSGNLLAVEDATKSIERLKELIEKKIKAMEYTFHQEVGVVITTNAIQETWKVIDEELPAMLLVENGEGYAEGIRQTTEATKRTEKLLLDECCEALGWQGGTIHQIINVLSAARRVKLVHDEVELSNDWDKFKAAIVTLKAVV